MRLSWAQCLAGVLTCAVVAGLLVLPSRLLGPDRPVRVAVPLPEAAHSVQAAPPLVIRHLHRPAKAKAKAKAKARVGAAPPPLTYASAQPRPVVQVSPGRKLLEAHRPAVIQQLAPTAPLVRARVLTAVSVAPHLAKKAPSTAKTIAALAASLSKN
jgi:hypothetical protein